MDFDSVRQFFADYVSKYPPYQEDKLYTVLMNNILDNYMKDSYNDIPEDFKSIYENGILIDSVYDQLLASIGVPEDIINVLRFDEKVIFLRSISDFQRYKGSVLFFNNISKSFNDKFDIYELYADRIQQYDSDLDEMVDIWVLKPKLIYKGTEFQSTLESIDYNEVYNYVPNLLVSSKQLENYYQTKNTTFPLKTNLILLDYNIRYDAGLMRNLVISTVLKDYGDQPITLYMTDDTYNISLNNIFYIWYYLMTKYYGTSWAETQLQQVILLSKSLNPYRVSDLDDLYLELDSLETSKEIADFYQEKISKYFSTIYKSEEQDADSMAYSVAVNNRDFYDYVEGRISNYTVGTDEYTREFNTILNEIYNSLLLFEYEQQDSQFQKYFDIFLYSLPHIIINPKETTTYTILYNMKPYHVDMIDRSKSIIVSEDKFNNIVPDMSYEFLIEMIHNDFLSDMYDAGIFNIEMISESDVQFSSIVDVLSITVKEDQYIYSDDFKSLIEKYVTDTEDIVSRKLYDIFTYSEKDNPDLHDATELMAGFTQSGVFHEIISELRFSFLYIFGSMLDIVSSEFNLGLEMAHSTNLPIIPELDTHFGILPIEPVTVENVGIHNFNKVQTEVMDVTSVSKSSANCSIEDPYSMGDMFIIDESS